MKWIGKMKLKNFMKKIPNYKVFYLNIDIWKLLII